MAETAKAGHVPSSPIRLLKVVGVELVGEQELTAVGAAVLVGAQAVDADHVARKLRIRIQALALP
jgi:hypothetical protein